MGMLAASAAEVSEHFEIPFEPVVYGAGTLAGLLVLLAVTFAFRSVAKRQQPHQ